MSRRCRSYWSASLVSACSLALPQNDADDTNNVQVKRISVSLKAGFLRSIATNSLPQSGHIWTAKQDFSATFAGPADPVKKDLPPGLGDVYWVIVIPDLYSSRSRDISDKISFVYTNIGRGHPFYLDGIREALIRKKSLKLIRGQTDVFELSRGLSLMAWKMVRLAYRMGANLHKLSYAVAGHNAFGRIIGEYGVLIARWANLFQTNEERKDIDEAALLPW